MKNYIKNYIIDNMPNLEGTKQYVCDIASALYKSDNITGSITCNRAKSEQFIADHKKEYANVIEYWRMHGGADFAVDIARDYFDNPEKAHCILVFTYVDSVFSWIFNGADYNDQKEMTQEFIQEIENKLDRAIDEAIADMDDYGDK